MIRFTRALAVGALCIGAIGACSNDEPEQQAVMPASSGELSPLVQYIPADSPYLAANLEPVPEAVRDKLWGAIEPALESLQQALDKGLEELAAKEEPDQKDTLLLAIMEELDGKLTRAGMNEFGIGGTYYALYGDGVIPVLRIDLVDRGALLAAVDRIQTRAGMDFQRQQHAGSDYYELRAPDEPDGPTAYVAITEGQLAVGIAMPGTPEEQTAVRDRLLGLSTPQTSALARINETNATYGMLPYGTGMLDPTRLMEGLLALLGEFDPDAVADLSAGCRADMGRIAAAVPEIVSGYTTLDANLIEQNTVIGLAPDLVPGVKSIATPMKGLVPSDEGAIYFAYGLDLMNLKAFAQERIAAMQANPFQCEHFAEFQAGLDQMSTQLNQPIPPFVGNLKGMRFLVEDVDIGPNGQPEGGKMLAAVVMDNPMMMLGMGQAFVPEIAELGLQPDGEPRELKGDFVPPELGSVWVAMMNHGFGGAIGDGMQQKLPGFLDAPAPAGDRAPLMVVSYDMQGLWEIQRQMMDYSVGDLPEGSNEAEVQAMREQIEAAMASYYELFGRIGVELLVTDRGLEMRSSTTLR